MKNKKKVLVTGSSGFLGSHIVDYLLESGYNVVGFDLYQPTYKQGLIEFHKSNVLDYNAIEKAISGCDYVYHLAGVADISEAIEFPDKAVQVNILGTQNILKAAVTNKLERFVFASTIYVYSSLGGFYRVTKQACEKMIEEYQKVYDLNYTIVRYGSLYGARSNNFNSIRNILRQALYKNEIIRRGDGEEIREYINIKDAAKLSVKVLDKEFANKHIIVTGNQSMKIHELLTMIKEIFENEIKIVYEPSNEQHHYQITPFSFRPELAERLTPRTFIDIGQGILEVLDELRHEEYKSSDNSKIGLREKG